MQPDTTSRFRLLRTGAEGLAAMLEAIRSAGRTVRLETYTFRDSAIGRRFLDALVEAQARGVVVHVLVDAFGSLELPESFWAPLREAGGHVRWFNPMSLNRWTYRDHRKVLVCDDRVAIVGGFNVADEYNGDGVTAGWRDLGLEITGPLSHHLMHAFDRMYGLADFRHRRLQRLRKALVRIDAQANWQILCSGPGCRHGEIKQSLTRAIAQARIVRIATAYFLPTRRLRRAFRRVVKRGGRVQLMLTGHSDVLLAQLASRWLYGGLLRSGVEVLEYQPQMFHAKLIVIDNVIYVGSANLDTRSLSINYELLLRIDDPALAAEAAAMFDADKRHCQPVVRKHWLRSRTWWSKLKESWAFVLLAKLDPLLARQQWKALR